MLNIETMEQTYKWRNDVNKLPFNWKCEHCGTTTPIIEVDTNKRYPCSRENCPVKLKFVLHVI